MRKFRNIVACRRRENESAFPHPDVIRLSPPFYRGLWRLGHRALGQRVALTPSETRQLLNLRRDHHARLVHVYLGTEALRALPYLEQESCPKIVSFHGADLADSVNHRDIARLLECTDLFLCRCRALAAVLQSKGCPTDRIRIHYTGVPVPDTAPDRIAPQPGETLRLFQACRLIKKKGLDLSLHALRLLLDRGIPATLAVAGNGPEGPRLQALARELHLEPHVSFLGFLSQEALASEMQRAHLFLHPSRVPESGDREGIPNSLLEALAVGTPIIATPHSGIPEAVTDGEEGFLVKESPEAIFSAISTLHQDPQKWQSMSHQGWETTRQRFSLEASRTALETIYTDCSSPGRAT